MSELTIRDRFRLTCPEGFRLMTEEEQERLNILSDSRDTLCLTNEEGHMIVSIGWKDVNAFVSLLLHVIAPAKSMEANVHQAMSGYGYQLETALERTIGGQPAKGFRYTYTAGVPMVGESYVIREKRSLTFFHVYLRAEHRAESLEKWNALLDAVEPC